MRTSWSIADGIRAEIASKPELYETIKEWAQESELDEEQMIDRIIYLATLVYSK